MSEYKTCTKCGCLLPLDRFHTRTKNDGTIGYRPECKDCKRKMSRESYHLKQNGTKKRRTHLRQRRGETLYEFRCRVIKDAWERAAVRLAEKAERNG